MPRSTRNRYRHRRGSRRAPLAVVVAVLLGAVVAQPQDATVLSGRVDAVQATAAFGVVFGFPGYRTVGVAASLQAGAVGAAAHAAWGSAGLAFGAQVRAYPPVPWPLPTYLAAGADVYAGRVAPYAAVGAHVPLAQRWRLDLEGGVAWTPLLDRRQAAPYLSLGVSTAVAVGLAPALADAAAPDQAGAATNVVRACAPEAPDPARLDAALAATVRAFVTDATATFGSVYRDLDYRLTVLRRDVRGDVATVAVAYEGQVVERLTGRAVTAAGTAEVDFRWRRCGWVRSALRY